MKFIKYLAWISLISVLLFVCVVNFSTVKSRFECTGNISFENDLKPTTIYIILEEYRWWVGLWSDSDGNMQLEIPNKTLEYYSHVVEVGTQLQVYNFQKEMKGHFSSLSNTLDLSTPLGFFDGKCKNIN